MSSTPSRSAPATPLRLILTLILLALIGRSAWRSIPAKEIHFSNEEFALNRRLAGEAGFLSPPATISAGYSIGKQGVQLSRGGAIRYDLSGQEAFFRGVFQVADKTGGKVQVSAISHGQSTLLLERTLAPSRQDVDLAAFTFVINLATLPPGTTQLMLVTDNGTIIWREAGFVDQQQYTGFSNIPLDFLGCNGYSAPGWADKVMLVQSPTTLDFRVPAGHHLLTFRCGINPSLFNDPNAFSDGVGFRVELVTPTQIRELASRLLEPFSRRADRELQTISVDLNLVEPTTLRLSATPGPASNISWDWSIWQDFRLDPLKP